MSNVELVAICARNQERLHLTTTKFNVPSAYVDWREMLDAEEIDLVIIASPNALHHSMAREALLHNQHVILEKPAVIKVSDGRDLLALAGSVNRRVVVNSSLRFLPAVNLMRKLYDEKFSADQTSFSVKYHISRPEKSWYFDRSFAGGGVTFCLGTHAVDVIAYISRKEVKTIEVGIDHEDLSQGVEDAAELFVTFFDGLVGKCDISWNSPGLSARIEIGGSTHSLMLSMSSDNWWRIELDGVSLHSGTLWEDFLAHGVVQSTVESIISRSNPVSPLKDHQQVLEPLILGYERWLSEYGKTNRAIG